jgi:hypothetical protein
VTEGAEVLLHGGYTNAGLVTRVGDTVRRPSRPTSPAVQALLTHLERAGFDGAPRWLGLDDQGREVLSFVEGQAAIKPHQPWALTDEALVSVAQLLRRYHDAVASFDPAPHAWPPPVPAAFRDGLVSHNDPNLDNVIFVAGRAVALIDFDLAGPGSVVWDVACAVRHWAPLRETRDAPELVRGRWLARLRIFADAYGLKERDRSRLADAVLQEHDWSYDVVRRAVRSGHEAFARMFAAGGEQRSDRAREWIVAHQQEIRGALAVDR